MKVRAFLIADAITTAQGKSYVHGGGITQIAGSFPHTQPELNVLLRLERADERLGSDHEAAIRLFDPADHQVVELRANYRIPGDAKEGYPITMDLVGYFTGLTFETPGIYHFKAFIDDVELDSIPLVLESEDEESSRVFRDAAEG
jgi:hypothetical protein